MQLIKRVIQLAKDRALFKFSSLIRAMVKDAEAAMLAQMAEVRSGWNQRVLSAALQVLRKKQTGLVTSIDARFRDSVDRGMRTMYTDLREGLGNLSANTLSLIDDETVNRQLEVGHLVQRLRSACDENLGRLNIMIAQMHGDADVHERENPFRPYLIAGALYHSLKEIVPDEEVEKVLFGHLSDSLAAHLSGYYAAICEVFDENGVHARLLARPTELKRHQRAQLTQQLAALNSPTGIGNTLPVPGVNPQVVPALQRMFESFRGAPDDNNNTGNSGNAGVNAGARASQAQPAEFQNFVWSLFNQTQAAAPSAHNAYDYGRTNAEPAVPQALLPAVSAGVLQALERFQRLQAESREDATAAQGNQLFTLGEQLDLAPEAQGQRMAIDVVAVLFEFILDDEQIPAIVRARIGRLQIPFLKAAMLEPQLLQQGDHPARQLLNRIASAAVGLAPESAMAQRLDGEVARLVKRILQDFVDDTTIFSECLQELEQFLGDQLANADAETVRSIRAAEDAEKFSAALRNTVASLHDILAPMEVDQRMKDFIEQVWARVLVRAAGQDAASGSATLAQQYRDVLPELVWSAQEKTTAEDRNALMRMLPGLVKRLRIGMLMLHMPEDAGKAVLDRLVPVHTQALRPLAADDDVRAMPSLDAVRKEFIRLVTSGDSTTWILTEPLQVEANILENALAERGAAADMDMSRPSAHAAAPSAELLSQLQVGSCVECRAGDAAVPARLVWVSQFKSLFIFKLEQQAKPLVYSAEALLQALQSGKVGLMEYAPAFDRAVDALMMGAETVQAQSAQTAPSVRN